MILMCHFTAQSSSSILNMSSQFFNIGVEIFIILSGFLFGTRSGEIYKEPRTWYRKRLQRIYIPYEIFILILSVVHILRGISIFKLDWLWLMLGLQGSVVGVLGAEQTWFITPLLICYAITPLLDKFMSLVKSKYLITVSVCIFTVLPLIWSCFKEPWIHTLLSLVSYYCLAYILGHFFDSISITPKMTIFAFFIMCCSFMLRFLIRHFFDGTVLYDSLTVGYTQTISAFCIFLIFAFLFHDKKPIKLVTFISNISFEIYLIHYMFCVGPARLFDLTPYWALNCLIVLGITIIIAFIINKTSNSIIKKISR